MHIKATLCVSIYFIVKIEIITVSTRFGKCVKNVFVKVDKKHAINIVSMRGRYLKVAFLYLLCRRICRRVSSIWAINICMYVCMYTRILIPHFSVSRTFTSMPINGLNINF